MYYIYLKIGRKQFHENSVNIGTYYINQFHELEPYFGIDTKIIELVPILTVYEWIWK